MKKSQPPSPAFEHPLYHDTWQLLKAYRDAVWSLELSARPPGRSSAAGCSAQSIRQSRQMLDALTAAVDLLRLKHKHGESYYWLLYYSFLSPQKPLNTEEIIEKLRAHLRDISLRTYYRKRREAIRALSALLWGYVSTDTAEILEQFSFRC
ncbi:MAG: hypothetical protein HFI39_02035 [Lachnospiraceae bacterium]|nr:hypothetical protein [Lachnospiraceae bacterium]